MEFHPKYDATHVVVPNGEEVLAQFCTLRMHATVDVVNGVPVDGLAHTAMESP
jgi:hypothetical protein